MPRPATPEEVATVCADPSAVDVTVNDDGTFHIHATAVAVMIADDGQQAARDATRTE